MWLPLKAKLLLSDYAAEKYFKENQSFLFSWTDHGRELCWLDGTTIAFHEELAATLHRLALNGIPKFPFVVLAMASLRASWPDVRFRLTRLISALENSHVPSYAVAIRKHQNLVDSWKNSSQKLELLTRYATTSAVTVSAKAELLASLFDRFESNHSGEEHQQIAAAFAAGLPQEWVTERRGDGEPMTLPSTDEEEEQWRSRPPVFHRVLRDVLELIRVARVLAKGLHDYSPSDLKNKVAIGFTGEISPPEECLLDAPLSAAELLSALQDDAEFSGFANLTRHLMATVSLPRSLAVTQELRAGGVSDISNRGQIDKLLISELAFDDLTLAVRIASNEAMYLRHETPPSPQADLRPVLIDTSLSMWGIPKLYATAMAMALRAGADERLTVECFRWNGRDIENAALENREQVAEQLGALVPTEHVGSGLAEFERRICESGATAEPVLITTSDPLASHTFCRALDRMTVKCLWVICVERDGQLQVMQRTRQGTSVRKKMHLPLESILKNSDEVTNRNAAVDLPAIFGLEEFPLHLSIEIRPGRVYHWGEKAIAISDDGQLMLWEAKGCGARQLCETLPLSRKASVFLVERNDSEIEFLVEGGASELVRVTHSLEVHRTNLGQSLSHVTDVRACGNAVIAFGARNDKCWTATAISRETGEVLSRLVSYDGTSRNGRCFKKDGVWHILSVVAGKLRAEPMPSLYQNFQEVLETKLGRFVAIEDGVLVDPEDRERFRWPGTEVWRDASEIFGYLPGSDRFAVKYSQLAVLVDNVHETTDHFLSAEQGMEYHESVEVRHEFKARSSHWRFRRISTDGTDSLILEGKHGRLFRIRLGHPHIVLEIKTGSWNPTPLAAEVVTRHQELRDEMISFEDCAGPPGVGYRLKLAQWGNGNKAWIDSRGLLHLRNAKTEYPEVSLVLRDGSLSGWLSTGEVFGEDYYCGQEPERVGLKRIGSDVAWEAAIKPFLGSIPWSFHYSFDTAAASSTVLPEF